MRYCNITSGPVVVTLRDGSSLRMMSGVTIDLSNEQAGSGDLLAKTRKGMLRALDSVVVAAPPPPVAAEMAAVNPIAPEVPQDLVVSVPQDLVEAVQREVAERATSSVELESPTVGEETLSDRDQRESKSRQRFGKHRS